MSTNIITNLLDQVDSITQSFTFTGYNNLVSHLQVEIHLAVVIYIAFLGWSVMNGWIDLSISILTKHVIKIAVALSLATHWDFFSLFIYNVMTHAPNELSSILTQSLNATSLLKGASLNEALQNVFDQGMQLGAATWSQGGISAISFYLYAGLIWLGTFLVTGIALLEFVVAKFGLALMLVLAPIFSLFLLWENTKGIFESWLRFSLGFALVPTFITASLMLLLVLLQSALQNMELAILKEDYTLVSIAPFLLGSIVGIGLLLKSTSIASNMSGGLAIHVMHIAQTAGRLTDKYSGFQSTRNLMKGNLVKWGNNLGNGMRRNTIVR